MNFTIVSCLGLMGICFLNSCAIHKEFPFICFAKGCVKEQFKVREIKAMTKRMKGKANLRKRKRNKTNSDINHAEVNMETKKITDTTEAEQSIQFSLVRQDTLITMQYEATNDLISIKDQLFLKQYIAKTNTQKIIEIFIQEFYDENQKDKKVRENNIKMYLISLGVPKEKITIKNPKESFKNQVEILIH